MAEGNGELVGEETGTKLGDGVDGERTEDYPKLLEFGLDKKVAGKLDDIYKTGVLTHATLDERELTALKDFPADDALNILSQFLESNLEHVLCKSIYLCGLMRTYRHKKCAIQQGVPTVATTVQVSNEEEARKLLERTGYTLDVTPDMAKCNGELLVEETGTQSGDRVDGERTEDYPKLLEFGLDKKVAGKLDDIYKTGVLTPAMLDERALTALKDFPTDDALGLLNQFLESNLDYVLNKSAYLCGLMKPYRHKQCAIQQGVPTGPTTVQVPNEEEARKLLERTGYTLDVTPGVRKYGGPPPNWEGPTPGEGCEIFCGNIPTYIFEYELIPLFEKCGVIWQLRLMMEPISGENIGYAFVTFTNPEEAQNAVRELHNFEIRPRMHLNIKISIPKRHLYVSNIPKSKRREEIREHLDNFTDGLLDVIVYSPPDKQEGNRGFCFLEYESHEAASSAKRKLECGVIKDLGCTIIVDWADAFEEPDEQAMSTVKILYVRNLTSNISEQSLQELFEQFGTVERVKRIKDYAFIHFENRDNAVTAIRNLNGMNIGNCNIEVSLSKPPLDKKKREQILRNREYRKRKRVQGRTRLLSDMSPSHPAMTPMGPMGGIPGQQMLLRTPMARRDYYYDHYGFHGSPDGYYVPYNDGISSYYGYLFFDYQPGSMPPPAPLYGRLTTGGTSVGFGHWRGVPVLGWNSGLRGSINQQGATPAESMNNAQLQGAAGGSMGQAFQF